MIDTQRPVRAISVPPMARWVPGTELPTTHSTDTDYEGDDRS